MISNIKKNQFIKNVSKLLLGTGFAQGLTVLSAPILTRLFSPEEFGVFSLYTSITAILLVLSTGKYELSFILPKDNREAELLLILSKIILITFSFILLILGFMFGDILLSYFVQETDSLLNWTLWIMIPIGIFLMGMYNIQKYWETRFQRFGVQSKAEVIRSSSGLSFQLISGVLAIGSSGLIIGQIIGQLCSNIFLLLKKSNKHKIKLSRQNIKEIKRVALLYVDFPKYNLPQALLNSMSSKSLPILLTFFFSPVLAGLYAISYRIIKLPSQLMSEAVKKVFYQKASEYNNRGKKLFQILLKTTLVLIGIILIPSLIIIIYGPQLFAFVFGVEWEIAGIYAQLLIPYVAMGFINKPAFSIIKILKWQRFLLLAEIFSSILKIVGFSIGAIYYNSLIAVAVFSFTGAIINLTIVIIVFISTKRIDKTRK